MSDIAFPPAADGTQLRNAELDDPWKWLMAGIEDVKRAPAWSLGYGLFFVLVGVGGSAWLWDAGLESLVPVLAGGFALVGPMLAVGLYEISRRLESGEPLNLRDMVFVKTAEPLQLAYMGFALLFMYFVWIRVAMLLYAGFLHLDYTPLDEFTQFLLGTGQGLVFLVIGTAIGAVFAVIVFAASALSVPMLMDRHVDVVSAIGASVHAVTHNPKPMLLWAWLIALLIAFGFATLFVGLIVVFPVIGHATWHAYRSLSAGIRR